MYSPVEAVRLLKDAQGAKFDETVEVHFNLGLNVRHADEQLRGTLMLPHGTGREARVAVFAEGEKAKEAEEAGADVVGSADLAKRVEEGFTDFDVAIATPDQMGNVGRLGRVLGPRGLMPNPKTGTVTMDVAKAVREAKAGKLEYRTDRGANVHIPIGKRSFDERRWSRTTPPCSTRSCARSRRSRRAGTSTGSRSRARWAPGSTSTRSARAGSSTSSTRRPRPSRLTVSSTQPVARDRKQRAVFTTARGSLPEAAPGVTPFPPESPPPVRALRSKGGGGCRKKTRNVWSPS